MVAISPAIEDDSEFIVRDPKMIAERLATTKVPWLKRKVDPQSMPSNSEVLFSFAIALALFLSRELVVSALSSISNVYLVGYLVKILPSSLVYYASLVGGLLYAVPAFLTLRVGLSTVRALAVLVVMFCNVLETSTEALSGALAWALRTVAGYKPGRK